MSATLFGGLEGLLRERRERRLVEPFPGEPSGTFIRISGGAPLQAHDNIFAGPGTPSSTGALFTDNLSGTDPLFVDPAHDDYHLSAGSPARGKGVDPGIAGAFSLRPAYEYVHPTQSSVRSSSVNLGAFE